MADPVRKAAALVSARFSPCIAALPFRVHPPPGGGTALPVFAAIAVPVRATVRVCLPSASCQRSKKLAEIVPGLAGAKVTATPSLYPGLIAPPPAPYPSHHPRNP